MTRLDCDLAGWLGAKTKVPDVFGGLGLTRGLGICAVPDLAGPRESYGSVPGTPRISPNKSTRAPPVLPCSSKCHSASVLPPLM